MRDIIYMARNDKSMLEPIEKEGVLIYPLGRIIPYNDYLLLSF